MVVKKSEAAEHSIDADVEDPTSEPGFHVVRADGVFLGTFVDREQADAFISGHVVPGDNEASVVEGPAAE